MNERARQNNGVLREVKMNSILPLRLLDAAHMMEDCCGDGCSSDGIYFDRTKGLERLNKVFQRRINSPESYFLEINSF